MRIVEQDGQRMVLFGVPQGRGLVFSLLVSLVLLAGSGLFLWVQLAKSGLQWGAAGPAVGVAFSLVLLGFVVLSSFKRERLTLDRVTRTGEHTTWSLLWGSRRTFTFPFDRVHSAAVQHTRESSGGGRGFPNRVTKARLLLVKPRAAIDLDGVQNGSREPIEKLVREVSEFLGVQETTLGRPDDD